MINRRDNVVEKLAEIERKKSFEHLIVDDCWNMRTGIEQLNEENSDLKAQVKTLKYDHLAEIDGLKCDHLAEIDALKYS